MGKQKSHRPSAKIAAAIHKKAKAKREQQRKEAKTKQYPKRSKRMLTAPKSLPQREKIEAFVHESSEFINKVLRPVQATCAVAAAPQDYRKKQLRREILAKHREKIARAQQSYQFLLDSIGEADLVLEVLDARDPTSCRLLEAEGSCLSKKPLLIVINKIDLIPQDVAVRWIAFFRQTAPTVALSATCPAAEVALREIIGHVAPSSCNAALMGIRGVGKSTIQAMSPGFFREIPSYEFVGATPEMGLLRGADFLDPMYDLALETIRRAQGDAIFAALEMPPQESAEDIIAVLARRWQIKPRLAGQKFIENLWVGEWRWFAVPPDEDAADFGEGQMAALEAAIPTEMSATLYIRLAAGEPLVADEHTLAGSADDDAEEEEEESEDDG
jgi:hypothetical protein